MRTALALVMVASLASCTVDTPEGRVPDVETIHAFTVKDIDEPVEVPLIPGLVQPQILGDPLDVLRTRPRVHLHRADRASREKVHDCERQEGDSKQQRNHLKQPAENKSGHLPNLQRTSSSMDPG